MADFHGMGLIMIPMLSGCGIDDPLHRFIQINI